MAQRDAAAFGIYRDRLSTASAIEALRAAGFRNTDIVALFPDEIGTWPVSPKKTTRLMDVRLIGAVAGLVTAGALVWLFAELSVLSGGPILSLSILTAGVTAGGVAGILAGRRIEAFDQHYENRVRRGDILVSVHCDDPHWAEKAKELLRSAGGDDVSSSDRATLEFARANRILVRPVSERTSVSPFRLIQGENTHVETRFGSTRSKSIRRHWPRRHRS